MSRPRPAADDAPGQLFVVGDVMLDVLATVTAPFAHASDTPTRVSAAPGGSAANLAVHAAAAGARVSLVAVVGDDVAGAMATSAAAAAGVDVAGVTVVRQATGTAVVLVEHDGQRSMLTDRGANLALSPRAVDRGLGGLTRSDHVHVSGYCLLDDGTRPAGLRALELAAEHGGSRSLDASSAGPLGTLGRERFLEWASGCAWLFCNRDEAEVLTGCTSASEAAARLATRVGEAVVTDGSRGVVIATTADVTTLAADEVPVRDTTGAGDAFAGTYLARRLAGATATDAGTASSAAAAAAVAARGARGGVR